MSKQPEQKQHEDQKQLEKDYAQPIREYLRDNFNRGGRTTYAEYRSVQAMFALQIIYSDKLDPHQKKKLLQAVAQTINRSNTGPARRSALRVFLTAHNNQITLKEVKDDEFQDFRRHLAKYQHHEDHIFKALLAIIETIIKSDVDKQSKKFVREIAIDEWVSVIKQFDLQGTKKFNPRPKTKKNEQKEEGLEGLEGLEDAKYFAELNKFLNMQNRRTPTSRTINDITSDAEPFGSTAAKRIEKIKEKCKTMLIMVEELVKQWGKEEKEETNEVIKQVRNKFVERITAELNGLLKIKPGRDLNLKNKVRIVKIWENSLNGYRAFNQKIKSGLPESKSDLAESKSFGMIRDISSFSIEAGNIEFDSFFKLESSIKGLEDKIILTQKSINLLNSRISEEVRNKLIIQLNSVHSGLKGSPEFEDSNFIPNLDKWIKGLASNLNKIQVKIARINLLIENIRILNNHIEKQEKSELLESMIKKFQDKFINLIVNGDMDGKTDIEFNKEIQLFIEKVNHKTDVIAFTARVEGTITLIEQTLELMETGRDLDEKVCKPEGIHDSLKNDLNLEIKDIKKCLVGIKEKFQDDEGDVLLEIRELSDRSKILDEAMTLLDNHSAIQKQITKLRIDPIYQKLSSDAENDKNTEFKRDSGAINHKIDSIESEMKKPFSTESSPASFKEKVKLLRERHEKINTQIKVIKNDITKLDKEVRFLHLVRVSLESFSQKISSFGQKVINFIVGGKPPRGDSEFKAITTSQPILAKEDKLSVNENYYLTNKKYAEAVKNKVDVKFLKEKISDNPELKSQTEKDNYKAYASYLIRVKLNELRELSKFIISQKKELEAKSENLEIERNYKINVERYQIELQNLNDIFDRVNAVYPGKISTSPKFGPLLKELTHEFSFYKNEIPQKIIGLKEFELHFNQQILAMQLVNEFSVLDLIGIGHQVIKGKFLPVEEGSRLKPFTKDEISRNQACAYYYFSKALTEMETSAQEINIRYNLFIKNIEQATLKEIDSLKNLIKNLMSLESMVRAHLKLISSDPKFLPYSEQFKLAYDHFNNKIDTFKKNELNSIFKINLELNGFLVKIKETEKEIENNFKGLAESNLKMAEEAVGEIDGHKFSLVRTLADTALAAIDSASPPKPAEKKQEEKKDSKEQKTPVAKVKRTWTDEEAYNLLKTRSPENLSIYDTIDSIIRDVLSNLPEEMELDAQTSKLKERFLKGERFLLSPKAYLYDYLKDLSWRDLTAECSKVGAAAIVDCGKSRLDMDPITTRIVVLAEKIAIQYPLNFYNLKDETIHLIVRRALRNTPKSTQEEKVDPRKELEKLLDVNKNLQNNATSCEIAQLAIDATGIMLRLEASVSDRGLAILNLVSRAFTGKDLEEVKDRVQEIKILCKDILTFDDPSHPNGKMKPGVGAHQAKEWLDKVLELKEGGGVAHKGKDFGSQLGDLIETYSEQKFSSSDQFLSRDAILELQRPRQERSEVRKNIRQNLEKLLNPVNKEKQTIKEIAQFLLLNDSKIISDEDKQLWRNVLELSSLTEQQLEIMLIARGLQDTIGYISRRLNILFHGILVQKGKPVYNHSKDSSVELNGITIVIPQGFIERICKVLAPEADMFQLSDQSYKFRNRPPKLVPVHKKKLPIEEQKTLITAPETAKEKKPKDKSSVLPLEAELPQEWLKEKEKLEVVKQELIDEEKLAAHQRAINIQNEQMRELDNDLLDLLDMFQRVQSLVNAQGVGIKEYDLVTIEAKDEDGSNLAAQAAKVSCQNNWRYPVLIKHKDDVYIYGNSSFTLLDTYDLVLLTVDNVHKIRSEKMGDLIKAGTAILAKNGDGVRQGDGKIYLLKFNGEKWIPLGGPITVGALLLDKFPPFQFVRKDYHCDSDSLRKDIIERGGKVHRHIKVHKWDGLNLILLSVDTVKNIPQEELAKYEKDRTPILVKGRGSDNIYLLKFNGQNWVSSEIMPGSNACKTEILSHFPAKGFHKHTEVSAELLKEIRKMHGNENWQLRKLENSEVAKRLFAPISLKIDGCDVDESIYEEIIKVEGHIDPCLDRSDAYLTDGRVECQKAEEELECAEKWRDYYRYAKEWLRDKAKPFIPTIGQRALEVYESTGPS